MKRSARSQIKATQPIRANVMPRGLVRRDVVVMQPAGGGVAVRIQHAGMAARRRLLWPIQIAGDEQPGRLSNATFSTV